MNEALKIAARGANSLITITTSVPLNNLIKFVLCYFLVLSLLDIAEVAETEDDFFNSDDDADEDVGSQITKDSKISKTSSGTTFLVHADGTFEQR